MWCTRSRTCASFSMFRFPFRLGDHGRYLAWHAIKYNMDDNLFAEFPISAPRQDDGIVPFSQTKRLTVSQLLIFTGCCCVYLALSRSFLSITLYEMSIDFDSVTFLGCSALVAFAMTSVVTMLMIWFLKSWWLRIPILMWGLVTGTLLPTNTMYGWWVLITM